MTREEAEEYVYSKYDINFLDQIYSYPHRNPSDFCWDEGKEIIYPSEIVELLIEKVMTND